MADSYKPPKPLSGSSEGKQGKVAEYLENSSQTAHLRSSRMSQETSASRPGTPPLVDSHEQFPITGQETSRHTERYTCKQLPKTIPVHGRPLGGLEVMYHRTMSKGMDMICLMTKLSTTFPITPELAKQVLHLLAQKHPLLRMTIQCAEETNPVSSTQISFAEMKNLRLDFTASQENNWLSVLMKNVAKPFDTVNGPLWKCRMLLPEKNTILRNKEKNSEEESNVMVSSWKATEKQPNNFIHEATFLFVWHHSIMDGGYVIAVFKDFATLLDMVNSGAIIDIHFSNPLPPPVEAVLQCPLYIRKTANDCQGARLVPSVHLDVSEPSTELLTDYNHAFSHEIERTLSGPPRNGCLVFEFSEHETQQIIRACKAEKLSTNGIFVVASILAFLDLVYPKSDRVKFRIPFEFMMDLRKHLPLNVLGDLCSTVHGVASIHVPMLADISLSKTQLTRKKFCEMSRSFGCAIQNEVHSPETFQWIHTTVKQSLEHSESYRPVGKAPHVLCLSNMGRLDNTLTGDIAQRMKLSGLHGHPTVLIEESPIFFVSIFSLNSKFLGNISFCENYTSVGTATKYIGHFKKYFLSQAKL